MLESGLPPERYYNLHMRDVSPAAAAALAGLAFAMAWLVASVTYAYFTGGEVSPSVLVGAAVSGTVFGALNYAFRRR